MPDLFVAKKNTPKPQQETQEGSTIPTVDAGKAPSSPAIPYSLSPEIANGSSMNKVGMFSQYTTRPQGVTFEHQEANEVILLFLRRHFITNLRWVIITILLLLTPLLFPILASIIGSVFPVSSGYIIVALGFYYLAVIGYALLHAVVWFYNVGIITNIRAIDIDLVGITNRNVAVAILADIVDVEYSQKGFLASFFNYGDVHLQTEGIKTLFEYLSVPKPAKVSDLVTDLMHAHQ